MGKKWTEEEIKILRKLYLTDGQSVGKISEILERSEPSIRQKATREGIKVIKKRRCEVREFSDYERGFIEAALDADGSITLDKRDRLTRHKRISPAIIVSFSNNCVEWLDKIRKIVGCDVTLIMTKGTKNYQIRFRSHTAVSILRQLNLLVKEQRRKISIELYDFIQHSGGIGLNAYTLPINYRERVGELIEAFYA